jgi:hypothetical protein
MRACYKILHDPSFVEREEYFQLSNGYLSQHYEPLDSPTVILSVPEDAKKIAQIAPDFKIDPKGYTLNGIRGWKISEVAVMLGSYLAWKKFLETDYEYMIYVENDALFRPHFHELVDEYVKYLPDDWGILSMYVDSNQYFKYNDTHYLGNPYVCKVYQDWSVLCYVVTRECARKMIEDMETNPVDTSIDWGIYYRSDQYKVYTVKPDADKGVSLLPIVSMFQTTQPKIQLDL